MTPPTDYQKDREEKTRQIKERDYTPPPKYFEVRFADLIGRIIGIGVGGYILLWLQAIFGS